MTTKTTYILTLLFLISGFFVSGQNNTESKNEITESNFTLTISTYNHAELIFNGTLSYKLTENTLTINRRSINNADTVLISYPIDVNSVEQIKNIDLDSLNNFYFNHCVVATSGNEYFVSVTNDNINKKIRLHSFYNKQIELLINELNKHIPENLKIHYLTSETKQDCE